MNRWRGQERSARMKPPWGESEDAKQLVDDRAGDRSDGFGGAGQDGDSFTPMPLDSGFGPHGSDSQPSTPPEEIIKKFAAKESEFQDALNHYTYRRVARVQTLDDDNKVDGEWYEVDDVIFDPTGRRTERVV